MSHNRIQTDIDASVSNGSLELLQPAALLKDTDNLKDAVAVVTGGASGFGRLYAIEAAKQGAKVVIGDINVEASRAVAQEIKASGGSCTYFAPCDVSDWDSQCRLFEHAISTYGKVDVCLANAGISGADMDEFEGKDELTKPNLKTLDINLTGVIYTTRIALHHMKKNPSKSKSIVITGSFASFYGSPITITYTASKHAVLGFTRAMAYVGAPIGVNINMVAPYFADTPLFAPLKGVLKDHPLAKTEVVRDAMIAASTDPYRKGAVYLINANGVYVSKKISPIGFPRL